MILRLTLKFLETVYPPQALKLALKLFFTPLPFPRPEREKKSFEQGEQQKLMVGKKQISVYTWGKSDKKILLVHGWSGRATQFFKIKNYLLSRGFQVIAFDAPAHGENKDHRQTHMLEFVESIERVNMTYGPFFGAIGHSLGGLAILNAYNKGFKVQKIAMVASPNSIGNIIGEFCRRIRVGAKTEKGLIAHLIARYQVPLEAFSGNEQVKTVSAQGLIVHDVHDDDVSIEESRNLHAVWKGSKMITTKRLGHRSILMNKNTVASIADFFGKRTHKPKGKPAKPKQAPNSQSGEKTNRPPRKKTTPQASTNPRPENEKKAGKTNNPRGKGSAPQKRKNDTAKPKPQPAGTEKQDKPSRTEKSRNPSRPPGNTQRRPQTKAKENLGNREKPAAPKKPTPKKESEKDGEQ
ncbi:MAG: alpha/beta fold hydrolase [Cryomorphaceae bacterium]|nr:alpha/beta fold hydrolase [Cryomorphaceae bacterium]